MSPAPAPGREGRPDVVVVGAGPAGSTAAGLLAAAGRHVLLLERHGFPRAKACGECLNPGAVAVLRRLGLLDAVLAQAPARIRGWDLRTEGDLRASGRFGPAVEPGLALPRAVLDAALLDRARERGARVEEGVRVTGVDAARPGHGPRIEATGPGGDARVYQPAVVVGADGLRSVVARDVGAIRRRPRLHKASLTFRVRGPGLATDRGRLHMSDEGTVGIAPVGGRGGAGRASARGGAGEGRPGGGERSGQARLWNVTVVAPSREARRVLGGPAHEVLSRALARAAPDWAGAAERVAGPWGSGPFDWPSRPFPAPGVVLVGDAAGYFDPLTGQGIYRALRSAELAAHAIDRSLRRGRVSWASPAPGGRRMRRAFESGRRVQKIIEAVVSSRRLRTLALRRLGAAPAALDALIRVTGDARPVRSLAAPGLLAHLAAPGLVARFAALRGTGRS